MRVYVKQTIEFTGNVEYKNLMESMLLTSVETINRNKYSIGEYQRTNQRQNANQKKENKRSIILIDYSGSEHV